MAMLKSLIAVFLTAIAYAADSCPSYPPVDTVSTVDMYSDAKGSIVDPGKAAQNRLMLAPVTAFMTYLETTLDRENASATEVACPYRVLQQWANAGALLKPSPDTPGKVARAFMSTGFGMIVLKFKLRGVPITPDVGKWLAQLAAAVRQDLRTNRGYVYPYTGATAAVSAIISGDAESLHYQDEVWANATAEIRPTGTIPAELHHGSRTLIYHQMTANGLLLLHHLRHYGLGRHDEPAQIAKLKLLLNLIGKSLCNPKTLAGAAGAKQDIPGVWGYRLAFPFDDDDLIPETWTTCGPANLDYFDLTGGGDTRVSAQAIRAVRGKKPAE